MTPDPVAELEELEQFTTWLNGPDLDAEVTELAEEGTC